MNPQVLVVDDETFVAEGVRAYLEDEDMEVRTTGSAEAAIEAVRQGLHFHVCIMDMRLTGMDGNAAIRTLAYLDPHLRFLIHTGSAGYVIPDDLRALGLTNADLFFKPQSDIGPLAAAVRRAVLLSPATEPVNRPVDEHPRRPS
ncbi:Response regulator [Gammaproteobacteria bacterium]